MKNNLLKKPAFLSASIIAAVGAAAAAAFPSLLLALARRALRRIPGYVGTLGRIRLGLFPPRVALQELTLQSTSTEAPVSRVAVRETTLALTSWKSLRRRIAFDVAVDAPALDLTPPANAKAAPRTPKRRASDHDHAWPKAALKFPVALESLAVRNGTVNVRAAADGARAEVDVSDLRLHLGRVSTGVPEALSPLEMSARVNGGAFRMKGTVQPLLDPLGFNVDASARDIPLSIANDVLRKEAGVEVESGTLNVDSEVAADDGHVKGYLKPLTLDVRLKPVKKPSFLARMKGVAVKLVTRLLKNRRTGGVGTKIPFSGRLDRTDVKAPNAVGNAFRHAFVRAYTPGVEGRLSSPADALLDEKPKGRIGRFFAEVKDSFSKWSDDEATRMAATLSYYTVFSMAPLLLLVTAVAGFVFGPDAVQGRIVAELRSIVGATSAKAIESMIQAAWKPAAGVTATVASVVTLIAGASAVMVELKFALNRIWRVTAPTGLKGLVKDRIIAFSMVLGIGFLLLVSLVVTAALSAVGSYLKGAIPFSGFLLQLLNFAVSFAVISFLFAALYKFMPDTHIRWRQVWRGAIFTTVMFTIGKTVLGVYLGSGSVGSSYGAASSVLIILLWVYYSAAIFYFGAEFTHISSTASQRHRARATS